MRIAFVGLGTMGGPMAGHLLAADHQLVVHDVRRASADPLLARGAAWSSSPAEAASNAEIAFTSLPGPKEVEAVVLGEQGVLAGARRGAVYADLSTSSVGLIKRIHAAGRERGVAVLDAPVSGGPQGAHDATLQVMVGGELAAFERVEPVLRAIGQNVTHVGEVGAGTVAKLVHNMVSAVSNAAVAEGLTLGVKAGVDAEKLLEVLKGGAFGTHYTLRYRLPEIVFRGDFDTVRFALALLRKDVGLATELGREVGVPLHLAAATEQDLVEAINRGWGGRDASALFQLQEQRAGVELRAAKVAT